MWPILIVVYILSSCHAFIGILSICIGVAASVSAEVWLAHSVSPIWSGGCFLLTAGIGIACAKKKSPYLIMCYTAFSIMSMVVAVVSIQLLKNGLVNHTSDNETFLKETDDKVKLVIIAIAVAGTEILVCFISSLVSCRVAHRAKKELQKKSEGTFSVQILGDKDIIIHTTKLGSYDKLSEQPTESSNSIEKNEQSNNDNDTNNDAVALTQGANNS